MICHHHVFSQLITLIKYDTIKYFLWSYLSTRCDTLFLATWSKTPTYNILGWDWFFFYFLFFSQHLFLFKNAWVFTMSKASGICDVNISLQSGGNCWLLIAKVWEGPWAILQLEVFSCMKADIWFASYKYISPVVKKNTVLVTVIVLVREKGVWSEDKASKTLQSNNIIIAEQNKLIMLLCFHSLSGTASSWSRLDRYRILLLSFLPGGPI